MKKRHQQKLVLLSVSLLLLFNVPLVLLFDKEDAILGFPVFYFSIFSVWLFATIISYIVLTRYYE
ncbi:MAG: hypothetical protein HWE22_13265 [Flavobacteriales bacterium]|nr:hypothetical protein [Flavobacteriales bacterium]